MTDLRLVRGQVVLRGTATGRGPVVLLLHAGGESRRVWSPVSAVLTERGMRTVAFDLRGHGESSGTPTALEELADDVTAMIRAQEPPIVVVGASVGGLAAIAAVADPATARYLTGLVLVDVVPDPDPARARAWLDERGLRQGRIDLVEDILDRGPQLLAVTSTIDVPIVLVQGGAGSPLGDDDVQRLTQANPWVSTACVRTAGHLVARDAPAALADIIAARASIWFGREQTGSGERTMGR